MMLMFEVVRSKEVTDRITDFVAIGNLVDKNFNSYHSAFVIQHNNSLYEFHYTGREILFNLLEEDYYHKITDTILPDEVPAFIALCLNVLKNAKPTYGYFYSGESYDINGHHKGDSDLGERMTCVGFCLNVLKGFLEEDYLRYEDWTAETVEDSTYLDDFCKKNNLEATKISNSVKRITPRESLTSCFFVALPIPKKGIDEKIIEVNRFFEARMQIMSN